LINPKADKSGSYINYLPQKFKEPGIIPVNKNLKREEHSEYLPSNLKTNLKNLSF
jgi:hypothetical protein